MHPFTKFSHRPPSVSALALLCAALCGCAASGDPIVRPLQAPSERVHIFYYNWYGAPPQEKTYVHWQQGGHTPPEDVGADYYPALGAYSSSDPKVLARHMQWIREAGAGVVSLTWWGRDSYEDRRAMAVFDAAAAVGLKVNFHLEPYAGMTPDKLEQDILYLLDRYGGHAAFHRSASHGDRPMFYLFETLRHNAAAWRPMIDRLRASGRNVLLIAQTTDLSFISKAGFDGAYTYDGLAPFKDARYLNDWPRLAQAFKEAGKLFIPSVGPGYSDNRAVPNGADEPDAARTRDGGADTTYRRAWAAATEIDSDVITITSFNEWHEGSQIEPAVPKTASNFQYPGYARGERHYLDLTAELARAFIRRRDQGALAPGKAD